MRLEFPYLQFREKYLPMIPLALRGKERIETIGLVDSGAAFSIFKPSFADILGINIRRGERVLAEGISGRIQVDVHEIEMEVEGIQFKCRVGFSPHYSASINIIGREGFFHHFIITFDEKHRKVILEENI